MRFREGTPNNSLSVSPSSSPLFNVGYFLLPSYDYVLPTWLAGPASSSSVFARLTCLTPSSLGVAAARRPFERAGVARMDEMERQTKQRWESRGTSHGLKGGDGGGKSHSGGDNCMWRHFGAVLTMATTMMPTKFLGCH